MQEMEQQEEDLERLLPDDAIADILRRLSHRSLAVSRCVCRAWRDVVDASDLMLRHLLPHLVGGIFIDFGGLGSTKFLARPTTGPKVSGNLDFADMGCILQDHCNGLVLFEDLSVANPATRRWAYLPEQPLPRLGMKYFWHDEYLVFDPAVCLHYEVGLNVPSISFKLLPGQPGYCRFRDKLDLTVEESEWPPSPLVLQVFSSRTGQWEVRSFIREGKPAGTVGEIRSAGVFSEKRAGVYWRGVLYVHCGANFVMGISLSDNKYQVIQPPPDVEASPVDGNHGIYLGRSEKGVYCSMVDGRDHLCQLRVWILTESNDQMEWAFKHQTSLTPVLGRHKCNEQSAGPWILQDVNSYNHHVKDDTYETLEQQQIEWDSDNDNAFDNEDAVNELGYVNFLGFHPYKEVVFLGESMRRGLAYHWNSLKFQDLGNIYPRHYNHLSTKVNSINGAFPYTPCWIDGFPLST